MFKLACFNFASHFNWPRVARDLASQAEVDGEFVLVHLVLTGHVERGDQFEGLNVGRRTN